MLEAYSQTLGTLSKIFRVRDFPRSAEQLADDSIIVCLDAFDVLCIRDNMNSSLKTL